MNLKWRGIFSSLRWCVRLRPGFFLFNVIFLNCRMYFVTQGELRSKSLLEATDCLWNGKGQQRERERVKEISLDGLKRQHGLNAGGRPRKPGRTGRGGTKKRSPLSTHGGGSRRRRILRRNQFSSSSHTNSSTLPLAFTTVSIYTHTHSAEFVNISIVSFNQLCFSFIFIIYAFGCNH
jgi:hypothetical protein